MPVPGIRNHTLFWILTVLSITVFTIGALSFWFYTVEDAFISFRYCDNFLQGKGLVFNTDNRVEGYTNFLWILVVSIPRLFLEFPLAAKIPGFVLGLSLLLILILIDSKRLNNKNSGAFAAVMLAACPGLQMWSVAGLETVLFSFNLMAAFFFHLRETRSSRFISGLFFGCATLTRPEGIFFFALFFMGFFWQKELKIKDLCYYLLGFLLVFLPHMLFRYLYYDAWVPNTFWVKSRRFRGGGTDYLVRYAAMTGFFHLPVALMGLWNQKIRPILLPLLIMASGYTLYVHHIGGDWMPYGRFIIPVLPMFMFAAAITAFHTGNRYLKHLFISLLVTGTLVSMVSAKYDLLRMRPSHYRDILTWETKHMKQWKTVGLWFKENTREDAVLCTGLAGIIPYYSQMKTVDRGGLNDREIAQIIYNSETLQEENHKINTLLLDRKPDYILIESRSFQMITPQPVLNIESGIDHPEFSQQYRLRNIPLDDGYFAFYQKMDSMEEL